MALPEDSELAELWKAIPEMDPAVSAHVSQLKDAGRYLGRRLHGKWGIAHPGCRG